MGCFGVVCFGRFPWVVLG